MIKQKKRKKLALTFIVRAVPSYVSADQSDVSHGETENGRYREHAVILPLDGDASVLRTIPQAREGSVQARLSLFVFLADQHRDDEFQLRMNGTLFQTFDDLRENVHVPLTDTVVDEVLAADVLVQDLFDDRFYFIDIE